MTPSLARGRLKRSLKKVSPYTILNAEGHIQPNTKQIVVMKETIIFITPPQPHVETIMQNGWKIKLVALRLSDGGESKNKYNFNSVPHDFYQPCIFWEMKPDGRHENAIFSLPNKKSKSGKGIWKGIIRRWHWTEKDYEILWVNALSTSDLKWSHVYFLLLLNLK